MFIISATADNAKYYYDGSDFIQNAEFAEIYFDVFDAILEMLVLASQIHCLFCNLKVEEI